MKMLILFITVQRNCGEFYFPLYTFMGFPGGSDGKKNLPAMQETWVRPLGQEDSLDKGMATHSSILAWKIPWTEGPAGLQ